MKELQCEILNLIGCQVTKVTSGGSNGSIFVLYFEKKENQKTLSVYCSWRLASDGEVLTGSNELSKSSIPKNLNKIKKSHLQEAKISDLFDLTLLFDNGLRLDIFCDITPKYPNKNYDENWYLALDNKNIVYTIDKNFHIKTELLQTNTD